MKVSTVSESVVGGASRTSRRPTPSELVAEAWHVIEDLPVCLRNWGATAGERGVTLPGDELVSEPADVVTRGGTGFALPVAQIEPERAIVLRKQPPAQPWDAVWSFNLLSIDAAHCRLLSRGKAARQHGPGRMAGDVMDPVTLLMTRKMLLGIKERSESATRI